jgi:hypothetical protein
MLPFCKAYQIAESWVSAVTDGKANILKESIQPKPYGWIFFYQSTEFIQNPANISAMLVGNAPILVDRINAEVRVLGPGAHFDQRLTEIEKSLPPACLQASPEIPKW